LVITRELPEEMVYVPPSARILQVPYTDSRLQKLRGGKLKLVTGYLHSLRGQLCLALKIIRPAMNFQPDIIHSFGALTLPAAYSARLVTGSPVVVSLHGTDFHRINRSAFLIRWLSLADAIVCVSQHMETQLRKKLPDKPIFYCPSGVDLSTFYPESTVKRHDEIVCVGRLTTVKRYDLILEAFARIVQKYPEYRLKIMGRGELLADLQNRARVLNTEGLVVFGGVVGKEELAHILRSAKLFLMASDWEGTPKAMLEAMACGLPVVSTDVGDCARVARGAGKVTADHSPAGLAQAVLDVLENGRWEQYSRQAMQNASQFDWSRVTERLKDVYSTVHNNTFAKKE